jgi:hypothetical protein
MSDKAAMNVLGAIDYKEGSSLVVQHCIDLLRRYPAAEAHFLHVSPLRQKTWAPGRAARRS